MLRPAALFFVLLAAAAGCTADLVAGGDVLLDRGVREVIESTGDPARLFAGLSPLFAGTDIVLANLECPLATGGPVIHKPFMFCADPAWASALGAAGFTALSLANNHAYDAGRDGLLETARHLRAVGILPLGAGENQIEACRAHFVETPDGTVALLACVDLPLEGLAPLDSLPGPADASSELFFDAVKAARLQADWVVVTVHWGVEHVPYAHQRQSDLAHRLAEAGVDVILGHHPHVIQPVERIGRTLVFYSLGNLVFDVATPPSREALLARIKLHRDRTPVAELLPLLIVDCSPAAAGLDDGEPIVRRLEGVSAGVNFHSLDDGWWRVSFEP